MSGSGDWATETIVADAQSLHASDLPARRGAWLMHPTRPAFVLGSSQRSGDVDGEFCAARGIDVVRRRSGGGAVHVDPVGSVWIDIVIPRGDALWVDDVGRAMHFVGRAWHDVLVAAGMNDVVVNEGPHVGNDWSKTLCVAGRGAGEVFVASGAKVVGISQRRTRNFARFQCVAYFDWNVDVHPGAIPMLRNDPARVATLVATMPAIDPAEVTARLAAALPAR
jgi:lipoate---protein ligase